MATNESDTLVERISFYFEIFISVLDSRNERQQKPKPKPKQKQKKKEKEKGKRKRKKEKEKESSVWKRKRNNQVQWNEIKRKMSKTISDDCFCDD